ncbi:MAG: HlyD family efflux transporter periplasmic adaptor subunit, partial [Bacteroidales bacterium]|nr:HlyD family efflux transporter periplasmic adaptor subunit [Bacteroidales bacterium]
LYQEGVLAEQKKDEVEVQMKAAIENANAAEAVYRKAKKGAREEDKDAANALVRRADGAVTEVNSYIKEQMIYAPIDGEIANIISEQGELVPSGYPVVSIVVLNDVWISFNLREDLLADIKKGSRFVAKFPALKRQEIELQVTYITAMGSFANWSATKTSGDFDMKTFEIHAVPTQKVVGLRPGMSALVDWDKVRVQ